MFPRRAARTDVNQGEIVEALRRCGASVTSLAAVGDGVPDLLVGHAGRNFLIEVKARGGTLTPRQVRFHGLWRGQRSIVRSAEEALAVLGLVEVEDESVSRVRAGRLGAPDELRSRGARRPGRGRARRRRRAGDPVPEPCRAARGA